MSARVLVAGVGNIFFGDDAFGPEVLRCLRAEAPLAHVRCEDFGIRGLHLAYELLSGYRAAVLVDAVARGAAPGTLYVLQPDSACAGAPDAHRMDLGAVFGFMRMLGGTPPPLRLVGCEPKSLGEGDALSEPVAGAVRHAVPLVRRVASELLTATEVRPCEA